MLLGRQSEREVLDRLLAGARRGEGSGVVVLGEPGIGKTALLEQAITSAEGFRVLRTAGHEGELELPYAALQQLCAPALDRLEHLPGPQRDALGVVFGLATGDAPDRLLVALAVLTLLSGLAARQPLLCVVDDAQWLDQASAQALAFVARRVETESVAFVLAAREISDEVRGLPELVIEGLGNGDARTLFRSVFPYRIDEAVLDRIVAETHGNPLALLEVPRGLTPAQLASGFGSPVSVPLVGRIEESFRRRLVGLPPLSRRLLLLAAAEPTGSAALVWRAAEILGISDGSALGTPVLQPALSAFCGESVSAEERQRWSWLAGRAAAFMWDYDSWDVLTARQVEVARDAGALTVLPLTLSTRGGGLLFAGRLALATSLLEQVQAVADITDNRTVPYAALAVAAFRGRENDARQLIGSATKDFAARGEGMGLSLARWATAVLCNGLGRYQEAFAVASEALQEDPAELWFSPWATVELIEASSRIGQEAATRPALERLAAGTSASGTDWARAIEARCRALFSCGKAAEDLYCEAIELLTPTTLRLDLARTRLLYGEWLRRRRRPREAREQLRAADVLFTDFGMEGFAARARAELRATGERARKRTVDTQSDLTPQEARISELVAQGASNPEIAAQLFISPSTVDYHLRKVFTKLGVRSRTQLARVVFESSQPSRRSSET